MKKSYICALSAIFFWSTVAVTSKILLDKLNNFQLLWANSFFAFLFLLIFNICTGNIKKLASYKPKDYLYISLIGLPGTFFYSVFYYAGTDRLPASLAFIVNYLWPVMSIIFAGIILKQKITLPKIIAVALSFLGVAFAVRGEFSSMGSGTISGVVFCLLGAIFYGLFTALNQKMNYDKCLSIMINYMVSLVFTTVIVVLKGDLFVPSIGQIAGFAWLGMFTFAVANTLWVTALQDVKRTAKISNLAYITPFASLIWTSLILKEHISLNFVIGLVFIVIGILFQFKSADNTDSSKEIIKVKT